MFDHQKLSIFSRLSHKTIGFFPQNNPPTMEKISGDPRLDGVEPHVAHAISTWFRHGGSPGHIKSPWVETCWNVMGWMTWVWINTYENTIFNGMNIHFNPAILMWTEGVLLVLTHCHLDLGVPWWLGWFLHLEHGDRTFQKHPGRWRHEISEIWISENGSNQQSGGV